MHCGHVISLSLYPKAFGVNTDEIRKSIGCGGTLSNSIVYNYVTSYILTI